MKQAEDSLHPIDNKVVERWKSSLSHMSLSFYIETLKPDFDFGKLHSNPANRKRKELRKIPM